ncbi:hypothetical protein HDZ31DRAFT_59511 [Schizophyllum fasciatum]
MRFSLAIVPAIVAGLAAATPFDEFEVVVKRSSNIEDPTNPQNLVNCPPSGGADACHHETRCGRVRINYGQKEGGEDGHYIWYNNHPEDAPQGVQIEVDKTGTCGK